MKMPTRHLAAVAALGLGLAVLPSVSSGAQEQATVVVVHGIPSVGAVDVCANGSIELLSDVSFGGVAPLTVDAGTYDLTVHAADAGTCTGATLITLNDAGVPAGANVSIVANIAGGTPNLAVYPNDVSEIAGGNGRVAVYHAANAPTVDVLVNGGPGIDDLAQLQVATADLPSASYDFTVTSADNSVTVATLEGVAVPAGQLLQVFAVGGFPDDSANPFQVVTNTIDLPVESTTTTTTAPTTTVPSTGGSGAVAAQPQFTG
jgi:hypothetical protein